ncbi:MAG: citrate synthase, partial [Candidatus Dadabacteria bacterium]|nr:citrate synthase [Candidatus Dadabacteria bacterium]
FPNVDLALGYLFNKLKIRHDRIIMITIISRMAGWIAHYFEQVRNNVLIRPD